MSGFKTGDKNESLRDCR